jgi:hypothetical protein
MRYEGDRSLPPSSYGPYVPSLRAGDFVEVRTAEEILATLDGEGKLDGLPFMPEMLQYCGQRFRVFRRADKTCDTIRDYTARRMTSCVHLEGLRCDGRDHGGCQAGCLLFWKEAWLRPVRQGAHSHASGASHVSRAGPIQTEQELRRMTRAAGSTSEDEVFVCQATELRRATTPLAWWDLRQYARDVRTGNVRLRDFVRAVALAAYNAVQRRRGSRQYPHVAGRLARATPKQTLDLRPGERVRVRTKEEILATLDTNQRNRGLWFDVEMVPHCGREYRVLRRVEQIIDERTGRMRRLPGDCIILDGVTCSGLLSRNRLFCPRSIYPYWREIWLERVE